jgi:hypothetical protein
MTAVAAGVTADLFRATFDWGVESAKRIPSPQIKLASRYDRTTVDLDLVSFECILTTVTMLCTCSAIAL